MQVKQEGVEDLGRLANEEQGKTWEKLKEMNRTTYITENGWTERTKKEKTEAYQTTEMRQSC